MIRDIYVNYVFLLMFAKSNQPARMTSINAGSSLELRRLNLYFKNCFVYLLTHVKSDVISKHGCHD